VAQLENDMERSAALELDRLMEALSGRYIPTGASADLVRNPDALPTGRNFFGLDPSRIPSKTTYEAGAKLAMQLVDDYRKRHGVYPDKLSMNLWGVETSRHEGVMEAQAMALMGVRPTWDERGRVTGVEAITRKELGRPRVDVTLISSGLFRDLFGNLLALMDKAAQLAQQQDDLGAVADAGPSGNVMQQHSRKTAAALQANGISADEARRMASVRIFGVPSGAYGTQIEKLIPLTNAWKNEREVADVFINRMSHPFGAGYWGDDKASQANPAQRRELFKQAISGSKIALHSRSSNLFATLDNDDFFQYLGGTAMAIRSVDGKTPEVVVSDLSNPRKPGHKTLEQYMGQEMQSRYLNPKWADSMLKEGYSGARYINRVVDYLWAWQVTVPEVVDSSKWQRMYDTYVADRHGLKVRERFAASGNLRAYQAVTDRMLSAIERGYWQPGDAVRDNLTRQNARAIKEAGVSCSADSCSKATLKIAPEFTGQFVPNVGSNPAIARGAAAASRAGGSAPSAQPMAAAPAQQQASDAAMKAALADLQVLQAKSQELQPVPAPRAKAKPADPAPVSSARTEPADAKVSGFEMQTLANLSPAQKTVGSLALLALAAGLVGAGYIGRRKKLKKLNGMLN